MGRLLICVALCALPLSAAAQAQSSLPPEPIFTRVLHARSLAMGGTYGAQGRAGDSIFGNPASMSLLPVYRVALSGGWSPDSKAGLANVSLVDSKSGPVAAGLSYNFVSAGRGVDRRDAHITTVATSLPLFDFLLGGFSTHYVVMNGARNANAMTVDGGLVLRFGEMFQLGASGHNLIPIHNPDLPLHWRGSLGLAFQVLNLTADLRMEPDRAVSIYDLNAGLELTFISWLPLRGGWSTDFSDGSHTVSGGLGFDWGSGGLDFAYRQTVGPSPERQLAATLNVLMF